MLSFFVVHAMHHSSLVPAAIHQLHGVHCTPYDTSYSTISAPTASRSSVYLVTMPDFDLLQCAEMRCHLVGGATTTCRWARVFFLDYITSSVSTSWLNTTRPQAISTVVVAPPAFLRSWKSLSPRQLIPSLLVRLHRFSGAPRSDFKFLNPSMQSSSIYILTDFSNPWEILIGHVVPRSPIYSGAGDASQTGGGAINGSLGFWFDCRWSPRILRGVKLNPPNLNYTHIHCLEFIVLHLQIVASIVYLEASYDLTKCWVSLVLLYPRRSKSFWPSPTTCLQNLGSIVSLHCVTSRTGVDPNLCCRLLQYTSISPASSIFMHRYFGQCQS
jgi:hypothetical protein